MNKPVVMRNILYDDNPDAISGTGKGIGTECNQGNPESNKDRSARKADKDEFNREEGLVRMDGLCCEDGQCREDGLGREEESGLTSRPEQDVWKSFM